MYRSLVLLVFVSACASTRKTREACAPVPAEFLAFGTVYAECAVDQRAKVVREPQPDVTRIQPLASGSSGCYRADFDMVVDEKGNPVPGSIKLFRTNSPSFAAAIEQTIAQVRYEPARKDGIPVAQLTRYGTGLAYTVSLARTGPPPRPPLC